jgi:hypothetical protein
LPKKLKAWLDEHANGSWIVEKLSESTGVKTLMEQEKEAVAEDPMVAAALSMFGGAKIGSIQGE